MQLHQIISHVHQLANQLTTLVIHLHQSILSLHQMVNQCNHAPDCPTTTGDAAARLHQMEINAITSTGAMQNMQMQIYKCA